MKKILSIVLVMVMVFSIGVFATETEEVTTTGTVEETTNVAEENNVQEEKEQIYFKAKVIEAGEVGEKEYKINYYGQEMSYPVTGQDVKLLVEQGKYKGVEISMILPLGQQGATEYDTPTKVGNKVYITVSEQVSADGSKTYTGEIVMPINSTREISVIVSIIVLFGLIVVLSRMQALRTIGLIILNSLILFVTFGILYFKAIPTIATLVIAALVMIISNTLIINNVSRKSLVAVLGILLATIITIGLCIFMVNINEIDDVYVVTDYYTGEVAKDYTDLGIAITIVASIGVAINMAIKTVNEYVKGEGTVKTIKEVSTDLSKCLNGVLLIISGTLIVNLFYIVFNNYPIHMMLFGDNAAFMEIIKIIVVMVNPIIVIPITAILSKLILQPTKRIDEAK